MKIVASEISEQKEEGLGVTWLSPEGGRTWVFSNVDVTKPIAIAVTYNTTGTGAQSATFSNINVTYRSVGGLTSESEVVYFVIGIPLATTIEVDFPDTSATLSATIAAYQAVIQ
jgi:hypothetical protein